MAELEAVRLGAARITVPLQRTYSLARDLPLAFGQLKKVGKCTFALNDDGLTTSHPATFANRIRAVDSQSYQADAIRITAAVMVVRLR
ncbi:hypothetical protein ACFWPK_28650 [Nocardia sp. NPDC058519]|uniref:Tc toxin subunit A-related protein n=1 Tax=Nocardia sp. NPDC058519 TaxID=3346535 RepID=UPI003661DDB8